MAATESDIAQISALIGGETDAKEREPETGGETDDVLEAEQDARGDRERHDKGGADGDDQATQTSVDGSPEDGEAEADGVSDESIQPPTLADLAEHLGIESKDLYNELEIPMGKDAEPITLGQFKDRVKELNDLDGVRDELHAQREEHTRERMAMRAELNQLMAILPPQLREEWTRAAGDRNRDYQFQQERQTLEAMPEWRDANTRREEEAAIVSVGNEYGFSQAEIEATYDHRSRRVLRDLANYRKREKAIDIEGKRKATTSAKRRTRRTQGNLSKAISRAKADKTGRSDAAAVTEIIRSQ